MSAYIVAEGIENTRKCLKELEREITCSICEEHYNEPKILPCLHYYCKQCVLSLAIRAGNARPFSCPECRNEATLPKRGVDELKTAFFVNRLKTTFSTMEIAYNKVEVKCEVCIDTQEEAKGFCQQCGMFICNECIKSHKRMRTFTSHEVILLDGSNQGKVRAFVREKTRITKCTNHEEPLTMYCFQCDRLICCQCKVEDHKEHDCKVCSLAAPIAKKSVLEKLHPLREVGASLLHAVEDIQTNKLELEAQRDSVANTIKISFKELHDILDKREQELLEEAGEVVQEKIGKLLVQERDLSLANGIVQSVVEYTERCLRHCTDNEIMSMKAEVEGRIEQAVEEHGKSGRHLDLLEDVGVEVRCSEALQQLCQTKANIVQLPIDLAKSTATVEVTKTTESGETIEATLTVTARLSNNKITRRNFISHIESISTGEVRNIHQIGRAKYSFRYTLAERGRYALIALADGQVVSGSRIPVFLSVSPTQLRKPVKIWTGIHRPFGITVNSVGDNLVTDSNNQIIKFDKTGKKSVLLQSSQYNLIVLRNIAVDEEDNIYCICEKNNKILKCDKNGSNVQVQEAKRVCGPGHCGVSVIAGEVMLCELNNAGTIMAYNKQLEYTRRIEGRNIGQLVGVSSDGNNRLYATDSQNSRIHVFSIDGTFLQSFGCDANGINILRVPYGVCVFDRHVYVSDWGAGRVSMFTTDGQYVTTFGQHGTGEGELIYPCSLCVDKDSFVYVTDLNNRIQIF